MISSEGWKNVMNPVYHQDNYCSIDPSTKTITFSPNIKKKIALIALISLKIPQSFLFLLSLGNLSELIFPIKMTKGEIIRR